MRRLIIGVITAATLVTLPARSLYASQEAAKATAEAPKPAGKWTMSLATPHGTFEMTFDLTMDGDTIGGTLTSDATGVAPVRGTFKDGKLAITADVSQGIDFHFTFKDADTLTGNLSSAMGDMACTAKRAAKKQ